MFNYTNFDSVLFIPVYGILLLLMAYLGNLLAKKERKMYEGFRDYKVEGLLVSFVTLLSLLYAFVFSGAATHYRDAQLLTRQETDELASVHRWSNHFDVQERKDFQKLLMEYVEFRADFNNVRNKEKTSELQDGLWNYLMKMENDPRQNLTAVKMLTSLDTAIHLYWDKYYVLKDRIPLPSIVLLFIASLLITFFVGYANENRDSHFSVNIFIFVSLNLIIMITIRELDMLHQGLIQVSRESLIDFAKLLRQMYETGK